MTNSNTALDLSRKQDGIQLPPNPHRRKVGEGNDGVHGTAMLAASIPARRNMVAGIPMLATLVLAAPVQTRTESKLVRNLEAVGPTGLKARNEIIQV